MAPAPPPTASDPDEEIVIIDDERTSSAPAVPPRPEMVPGLIARLASYAQGRLRAGIGVDHLRASGGAVPALIDTVGVGYIPPEVTTALTPAEATALATIPLAHAVVLPARDVLGAVVDLLLVPPSPGMPTHLAHPPQGLVGVIAGDPSRPVVLVDTLADLAARLAAGEQRIAMVTPTAAAAAAAALAARAVVSVSVATRQDASAITTACRAAGLLVEAAAASASAPAPSTPRLVTYDREAHRAVFDADGIALAIDTPWNGSSRVQATLRRDALEAGGEVDLAVPRQVAALVRASARKLTVEPDRVRVLFPDDLLERLQALEADGAMPAVSATAALHPADGAVEALAADPELVARFGVDTDALGWIGDAQAKTLALLTLAGRRLSTPPWLVLRGEPALTLPMLGLIAGFIPAEHHLVLTRPTEGSLVHQGRDGLRERLVCIHDATRLRPETVTTLAVLQARGAIAVSESVRDARTGRLQARTTEARGPIAVLAAAAGASPLDDLAILAGLDDAAEQTARVLAAERERHRHGVDVAGSSHIIARWQALLAGLPALPVRIPGADRVVFPARHPRHRVEQARFFALVESSALLHHRQRMQVDGALVATDADIAVAIQASRGVLGQPQDGLSSRARQLAGLMAAEPDGTITIPRLATLRPAWTRQMIRSTLDELLGAGLVESPDGGRGRAARTYTLVADPPDAAEGIRLLPATWTTMGGIGDIGYSSITNISPVAKAV